MKGYRDIHYQLIRSKRKTICLEVHPGGSVIVRAPDKIPKAEIDSFVESRKTWIQKHLDNPRPPAPTYTEAQSKQMRAFAKQLLPILVERFACLMGVSPNRVTITGAMKRFGSCSVKGNICFSWRLIAYPMEVIEYVVVHELAHLKHLNHSPAFYQFLQQHLPDYRQRAAKLKTPPDSKKPEESHVPNHS